MLKFLSRRFYYDFLNLKIFIIYINWLKTISKKTGGSEKKILFISHRKGDRVMMFNTTFNNIPAI